MTPEELKEEIILHIEKKLYEEYDERHKENNRIFSYASEGIERDEDAAPEITNAINAVYFSEQRTYCYRDLIKFINGIDIQTEDE